MEDVVFRENSPLFLKTTGPEDAGHRLPLDIAAHIWYRCAIAQSERLLVIQPDYNLYLHWLFGQSIDDPPRDAP